MRHALLGLSQITFQRAAMSWLGKHIPAGTALWINTPSLLYSISLLGPDADILTPERFMNVDKENRTEIERIVELALGMVSGCVLERHWHFMELSKVFLK